MHNSGALAKKKKQKKKGAGGDDANLRGKKKRVNS